jgi:hypothetical protein
VKLGGFRIESRQLIQCFGNSGSRKVLSAKANSAVVSKPDAFMITCM